VLLSPGKALARVENALTTEALHGQGATAMGRVRRKILG